MNAQPAVAVLLVASTFAATAQTSNVKPPQAQAWIDVATYSGMGMPGMGAAGGNPLGALGGLFGGGAGAAKNSFGQTQTGAAGRWVDVTLMTRANPSLAEAQQAVPAGFLSPALKLQSPKEVRAPAPRDDDDKVVEQDYERPKGKLLLYWGCGATVRPGQPKVLDMATASAADMAKFFVSRRATQRGAHSAVGRPVWPSPADERMVPDNASLVGEHQFSGSGVPEGFRFQIQAAQDLMPALQLQQADQSGATDLTWAALPTARAYFIAGMGAAKQDEMVIWTSSEVPEAGFGLIDYQTNAAVDRWLKEKVLLAPATTHCTVPKGVFPGQGGMLRAIAYGNELNLAHPPRPADPKAVWEPVWAAKLRVKSVATVMLGMPQMGQMPPAGTEPAPKPQPEEKKEDKMPKPLDLLKGILGR
ncbi:MAG TPA: hypothetical protein PLX45_13225 [Piscinibacter sp.]|nr:hypothetical protein [Piscinibacter sp.]HPM67214.1 hypothetical protein [Piscinibacter sp.]